MKTRTDELGKLLSETRHDRVMALRVNHCYSIQEVMWATGWSRATLYRMMEDGRMEFTIRGTHRRMKGQHVRRCWLEN